MKSRPLTANEIAVLRVALERAAVEPVATDLIATLGELRVGATCQCGCDSVWGTEDAITGMEVLGRTAEDQEARLPIPSSIIPW